MKPMTAVFGAVVVSAVLLFSAEPRHQRDAIRFIDRYAGNNYPPLTEWANEYDKQHPQNTNEAGTEERPAWLDHTGGHP